MQEQEFWFVVGSQDLYGPEVLGIVAERAARMAEEMSAALPYPLRYKGTARSEQEVSDLIR